MSLISRTVYAPRPTQRGSGKGATWSVGKKGDAAVMSKQLNIHGVTKRFHVVTIHTGPDAYDRQGDEYIAHADPTDRLAWALVPRSHMPVLGAEATSGTIRVGDVVVVARLDQESSGLYVVQEVVHAP